MGGVEADLERLTKGWKLTDDEEDGVSLPSGLWEANREPLKLCLVGRVLSVKSFWFEALSTSLQSMLLPVKGMEVKPLPDGRFLIRFNHVIDKQRTVDGCPWNFEKNLIILKSIGETENTMHVALNSCDFFVHVLDIPLSMMNLGSLG
ncbi:UNVERIFIED_CONTAM: hypothetical protein Slati_0819600 [Sesamum latifolium]|uniref:DUF4283 domain-containing protein n=1 Tax=Sesamum latifolium TaxID=2727402 RepID=A0AAW2XKY6_9LAMI